MIDTEGGEPISESDVRDVRFRDSGMMKPVLRISKYMKSKSAFW